MTKLSILNKNMKIFDKYSNLKSKHNSVSFESYAKKNLSTFNEELDAKKVSLDVIKLFN